MQNTFFLKKFNISLKKLSWNVMLLLFSLIIIYIVTAQILGFLLVNISLEEEEKIWSIMSNEYGLENSFDLEDNYINIQNKLQNIIDSLPRDLMPSKYDNITLLICNSEEINAYAAPGGRIILTTALIDSMYTENGLVFVLGHEIGHFMNNDHLIEFSKFLTADIFAAMTGSSISALQDLSNILDLQDSKAKEYQADLWGLYIVYRTYGHAGCILEFFELLKKQNYENNYQYDIFSSHPDVKDRIEAINAQILKDSIPISLPKFIKIQYSAN